MKKQLLLIVGLLLTLAVNAQKLAYQIYDKEGNKISYEDMLASFEDTDVIFFGELHNNTIAHWLELELARDLDKDYNLTLGAEMFEADDQIVMDEYLEGFIKHKHFKSEAKVWPNYETDYRPLVEYAKDNGLKFVATNIPRRYASYVARTGIDSLEQLSKEARQYMAKLPIEVDLTLPCYKQFIDMGMGHGTEMTPEKMAQAQASKDATMAHFIVKNMPKEGKFLHYNGSYHSDNYQSICHYLQKYDKKLTFSTITTVEAANVAEFPGEEKGKADFILVVPDSMTKTY